MKVTVKQFSLAVILLVVLLSSANIAGAVGLEYYGIENTINEDMTVNIAVTLKFDTRIRHLDYQLGFRVYDLKASADFDSVDCEVVPSGKNSIISCDFVGMTSEKNLLELEFVTREGVRRADENYRFTVNYGVSLPIESVFALIKLPEKGVLLGDVVNQSYFPQNGMTMTDGRHIMVYWEKENVSSGDDLQFYVLYSMPPGIPGYLVVSLTLIILVVMVGIAIYIKRGGKPKQDIITSVLNREENRIVDILKERGGKTGQKILVRESGFSKAKVSRLLKSLKERGVVETEPLSGRENRVILVLKGAEKGAEKKPGEEESREEKPAAPEVNE